MLEVRGVGGVGWRAGGWGARSTLSLPWGRSMLSMHISQPLPSPHPCSPAQIGKAKGAEGRMALPIKVFAPLHHLQERCGAGRFSGRRRVGVAGCAGQLASPAPRHMQADLWQQQAGAMLSGCRPPGTSLPALPNLSHLLCEKVGSAGLQAGGNNTHSKRVALCCAVVQLSHANKGRRRQAPQLHHSIRHVVLLSVRVVPLRRLSTVGWAIAGLLPAGMRC